MNFYDALERTNQIVTIYSQYEDRKNTHIKKGLEIQTLEKMQNSLLDELKSLTGHRSLDYAKDLLREHKIN